MARVIHLTPLGLGRTLSYKEQRAARALVAESIRTRLAEYRSRHLFARRPTHLAVLGQRVVARRRTLLVVTDGMGPIARILLAATVRATTPTGGVLAQAMHSVARRLSRRVVMMITMIVVLAVRHGHTGFSALIASAVAVAVVTSPVLTSLRVRCGDRALARRAATLLPELEDELRGVAVLHDLGLPRLVGAPQPTIDELSTIGAALSLGTIPTCIARPCCAEAGEAFATWAGALFVPQHAQPDRTVLVFPPSSDGDRNALAEDDAGQIVPIRSLVMAKARSE